jgi:tetratricopeptide (TPR) repeat protein
LTSKPERALEYSRRLRALNPNAVSVLLSEGTILAQLGRYEEAKEILQQYVAQKPEDPVGLNNFGTVLLALGENEGAALVLQQALELDPSIQGLYFNLAVVHARRKEAGRTVEWLEKAKPYVPEVTLQEWVEDEEFDPVRTEIVFLRYIDSIGLRDPELSDQLPLDSAGDG